MPLPANSAAPWGLSELSHLSDSSFTPVTSSWYVRLPENYCRIGISRGTPRGQPAGYKMFRQLAPGPWFKSVDATEFRDRYQTEILDRLDPAVTVAELIRLAHGKIPALLCFEPPSPGPNWCHRALVSVWLKERLNLDVFEYGLENHGCGCAHPKLPIG